MPFNIGMVMIYKNKTIKTRPSSITTPSIQTATPSIQTATPKSIMSTQRSMNNRYSMNSLYSASRGSMSGWGGG